MATDASDDSTNSPPDSSARTVEGVRARINELSKQAVAAKDQAEEKIRTKEADDRSFALKFIITFTFWLFAGTIAFIGIATIFLPSDRWLEAAKQMIEVIKIGALPLATFVLGQYFGSTRK